MARFFLNRQVSPPRRAAVRWRRPPRRPFIGIVSLTDSRVIYDSTGIDNCRFYRLTTTPAILVLVLGTNRGTDVGYAALGEAWETASGVFSLPSTRRHPEEKNTCVRKMAPVWTDFSTASQTDITTAMNLALNQTGYLTAAGGAVT